MSVMIEQRAPNAWPPAHFAVLQNGDGQPAFLRPNEPNELDQEFIDRIAGIVVRDIVNYPGTVFLDVIDGTTGLPDAGLSTLVLDSMARQRVKRLAHAKS